MRLVSFSVQKYRSIIKAERLVLGQLTILIGPNNEGKSNILRALVLGMRLLSEVEARPLVRGGYRTYGDFGDYAWRRDFPLALQEEQPDGDSILDFEFDLDEEEAAAFVREVKSQLNGNLPIRLSIGPRRVLFQVRKRGPGAKALSAKRDRIVRFLGSRIQLDYVPAVRTADEAVQVVRQLVQRELRVAEREPDFTAALAQIADLQRPILESLGLTLGETLRSFLPDVREVSLEIPQDARLTALRDVRIVVDDGTATDLRSKGEGAQSLAALSLIHHASQRSKTRSERILAVEEPEAHLHPNAIHELRSVLAEVAEQQQVVVTTHSPVLVNRLEVSSNVIVQASRARAATSVKEIREILGVRTSDNLSSADVVLVVEGESDRRALEALLAESSDRLRGALESGQLAIDTLAGGSNLGYKLTQIRDSLCAPHAYLDNDDTGINAASKAREAGLLLASDQTFTICPGMSQSEIEDLYDIELYRDMLSETFNIDVSLPIFRTNEKWSIRIRASFSAAGQPYTAAVERDLKQRIADLVVGAPDQALHPAKRSSFDALSAALERKLERAVA